MAYKGRTFQVEYRRDQDHGEPWKESDGHGVVSEWVRRGPEAGEFELVSDRGSRRYYDFEASIAIAIRDGWGIADLVSTNMTKRMIAELAVKKDYEYLQGWCNDDWCFVGVIVTLPGTDYSESVWGIESNSGAYLDETARALADQILSTFKDDTNAEALAETWINGNLSDVKAAIGRLVGHDAAALAMEIMTELPKADRASFVKIVSGWGNL